MIQLASRALAVVFSAVLARPGSGDEMPRRNQRESAEYPPLDLTPESDVWKPIRPPGRAHRAAIPDPDRLARDQRNSAERQRQARMQDGIDWSVCLVPGCGLHLARWVQQPHVVAIQHDPDFGLPLCEEHGVMVWQQGQRFRHLPDFVETAAELSERHRREAPRAHVKRPKPDDMGQLYFVRVNDLVKVGWTATLERRLKEYGAGAELLCHYPGTREDETVLHRRLTAVRAKGREWYHDCEKIQQRVCEVIAQYGPPTAKAAWTVPKNPVTIIRQASTG